MNHTDVYQLVNAARAKLGWQRLKGLPKGEPDHAATCVLACAFDADLFTGYEAGYATIRFNTPHQRDTVLAVWSGRGVDCHKGDGDTELRFGGDLYLWMRHFDVGTWEALIVNPNDNETPYEGLVVEAETLAELDDEVELIMADVDPHDREADADEGHTDSLGQPV